MSFSGVNSFYRRGSSVTGSLMGSSHDCDGDYGANVSSVDPMQATMAMEQMTPPITPTSSRRYYQQPVNDLVTVGIGQKLDRVLLMFEDFKAQMAKDCKETNDRLLSLQGDIDELKDKQAKPQYSRKKLPLEVSVSQYTCILGCCSHLSFVCFPQLAVKRLHDNSSSLFDGAQP